MKVLIFVVSSLLFFVLSYAHPLCYNGVPEPQLGLKYCSEYTMSSCCTTLREEVVVTTFITNNTGSFSNGFILADKTTWSVCDRELVKIACTKCSNYELHLYEISSSPLLCSSYCTGAFKMACPSPSILCDNFGIVAIDSWCYPVTVEPPITDASGFSSVYPGASFFEAVEVRWSPYETALGLGTQSAYVVEQRGIIYRLSKTSTNSETFSERVFLNWETQTYQNGELGLLGFEFDPDYATNCYIFIFYTSDVDTANKVNYLSRLHVPNCNRYATATVDITSECRLANIDKQTNQHNGGSISFDSNKHLFLSVGDGGTQNDGQNNGQNTHNLFGTIIRVNPGRPVDPHSCVGVSNYTVPSDNPFFGHPEMGMAEIYAWGFRNPWMCNMFQPGDRFYCGDVGQVRYEEISRIYRGKNYGWSLAEGDGPFSQASAEEYAGLISSPNYQRPLVDYAHSTQYTLHPRTVSNVIGFSITYGGLYTGKQLAPSYFGSHIAADFTSGMLFTFFIDETGVKPPAAEILIQNIPPLARIRTGPDGETYFVSYYGVSIPSEILRLDLSQREEPFCGNYKCEISESCSKCPIDCYGKLSGNDKWCCSDGRCSLGNCLINCTARVSSSDPLNNVCEPGESCLTTNDCPSKSTGNGNTNSFCCYGSYTGPMCTSIVNGEVVVDSAYCLTLNDPCKRGNSNGRGNGYDWYNQN